MPEQRKFAVAAAYLTLCVIWSSTWLAIKIGLRDLPPISFVALRFAIAVVVLLAISVGRVRLLPLRRGDLKMLAYTGVLMFAVNYALLFWAELHVSSGLSAVLQATIPIFGMVFAHYLLPGEPLRWQRVAGAIARDRRRRADLFAPARFRRAPRFLGRSRRRVRRGGRGVRKRAVEEARSPARARHDCRLANDLRSVPMLVLGFIVDGNPLHFHWTKTAVFCLFYLAVPGSAVTFLLLYWLLPRMSVTNLQTISLITPPGAVAFGWLLGGETFSPWSLAGGALVLAGVWMIFRKIQPAKVRGECETALPQG